MQNQFSLYEKYRFYWYLKKWEIPGFPVFLIQMVAFPNANVKLLKNWVADESIDSKFWNKS